MSTRPGSTNCPSTARTPPHPAGNDGAISAIRPSLPILTSSSSGVAAPKRKTRPPLMIKGRDIEDGPLAARTAALVEHVLGKKIERHDHIRSVRCFATAFSEL